MRKQVIYYNKRGQIDKFTTFTNNHPCIGMGFIVVLFILASMIESLT